MQAIVKVLIVLDGLSDNITGLMEHFAKINNEIETLVAEHESRVKKIAEDKANGVEMGNVDYSVRMPSSRLQVMAVSGNSLN